MIADNIYFLQSLKDWQQNFTLKSRLSDTHLKESSALNVQVFCSVQYEFIFTVDLMHIYKYSAYESTGCQNDELDYILRGDLEELKNSLKLVWITIMAASNDGNACTIAVFSTFLRVRAHFGQVNIPRHIVVENVSRHTDASRRIG